MLLRSVVKKEEEMASTSENDESFTVGSDDSKISNDDDAQITSSFVDEEESGEGLEEEDTTKSSITEEPNSGEAKSSEDADGTSPSDQDTMDTTDPSFAEDKLKEILDASDDTTPTFAENKPKEILEGSDDSEGEKGDTQNENAPSAEDDEISGEDSENTVNINVVRDQEDSIIEDKDVESPEQHISLGDSKDVSNISLDDDKEDSTSEDKNVESPEQDISHEGAEDEDEEDSTTEDKNVENAEQDNISDKSVDADVENGDSSGFEEKDVRSMPESTGVEQEIDDLPVENVDIATKENKHAEDLVEIAEKELESNDNFTNDDDKTSAKNADEEGSLTVQDVGMIAGVTEKESETPGLEDTINDAQKLTDNDNDSDVIEANGNQIIDNISVDDKMTDEHITNNIVENTTSASEAEDNASEKDAMVTKDSFNEAQREIEQSIDTLEVEDQNVVNDDTENEIKEIEKSVESITNAPQGAHVGRSHSGSFEASVERLKMDEQPTKPVPDPNSTESFEDVELSENNGLTEEPSDMEKYMERKADEERVLKESDQRQRTGSDQPRSESEAVKFDLKPSSQAKLANVSLSDDAETDSLHSMEESDHFKDRKKPAVPLDALRPDASSTDGSQSKSNNHRQTSYGSITSK